MKTRTMTGLYLHLLRDMYYAENHLEKALSKMIKTCNDDSLKNVLKEHLLETKIQSERLERIFESLASPAKSERCFAMDGLLMEAQSLMANAQTPEALHAAIIVGCRKIEHYEIGSYHILIDIAKLLGHTDQLKLLRETLLEEKSADTKLAALADTAIFKKATKQKGKAK